MALQLKRITWPYDCVKCDITRKLIAYGEYYYEDDEDGLIVDAEYYHQRKMADKYEEALLNPELNVPQDVMSYRIAMLEAERRHLDRGLLDRPVAGKTYAPKGGGHNAR
jgi:hypothetical protein